MSRLASLRIPVKLGIFAGTAMVLVVVMGVVATTEMIAIGEAREHAERGGRIAASAAATQTALQQVVVYNRDISLAQDVAAVERAVAELTRGMTEARRHADAALQTVRQPANRARLTEAAEQLPRYEAATRRMAEVRAEHLRLRSEVMFAQGGATIQGLRDFAAAPTLAGLADESRIRGLLAEADTALTARRLAAFRYLAAGEPAQREQASTNGALAWRHATAARDLIPAGHPARAQAETPLAALQALNTGGDRAIAALDELATMRRDVTGPLRARLGQFSRNPQARRTMTPGMRRRSSRHAARRPPSGCRPWPPSSSCCSPSAPTS